ncbi:MAG: HEAT repeat domain-containing protein [Planctomycetaceae bacterium]|jgi:HEAT repeat protein|nr:HEAT repeat domain-containing protein [Planctomycetaceae bacterium]
MTPFLEKTIRLLANSENASSIELLQFLLESSDRDTREKALAGLYLKNSPEILLQLFDKIRDHEKEWLDLPFLTPDRMSKIIEPAFQSNHYELAKHACQFAVRNKLYESVGTITRLFKIHHPKWMELAAQTVLQLAESFYNDLADAPSETARRNMDRRREWFASQLEDSVRHFGMHDYIEPIKAYLLVAKKNYPFLINTFNDIHSKVCKTIIDLLQNQEETRFYRLLLGFLDDTSSPAIVDIILTSKQDPKFISSLLQTIGKNPSQQMRGALKRFLNFSWIDPNHENLPDWIVGLEENFVQLIANSGLPRKTSLAMFDWILRLPSVEGRLAAIKAIRGFHGEDVNNILIEAAEDSDPQVCSEALRLMKNRKIGKIDQILLQKVYHPSELVRRTIYQLTPDFHIENFFRNVGQMTENTATAFGKIVRNVDSNTRKHISQEIQSSIPVRRKVAMDVIRYTGLTEEYEDVLIALVENDDETDLRIEACWMLATILSANSYKTLQKAERDRNPLVQQAAIQAATNWRETVSNYARNV